MNLRAATAFREIGCGFSAIETFSFVMNMKCFSEPAFRKLNETLNVVYKSVAEQSMINGTKVAKIVGNVNEKSCARVSIDFL